MLIGVNTEHHPPAIKVEHNNKVRLNDWLHSVQSVGAF